MAKEKKDASADLQTVESSGAKTTNVAPPTPVRMLGLGGKCTIFYDPENKFFLQGGEKKPYPNKVTPLTKKWIQNGGLIEVEK